MSLLSARPTTHHLLVMHRPPTTQELLGVLIGRVLERCEALGNEGCGQGLGAVDLNAATSGVIGVGDMVGHERLLDEMNAGAQDDSDRLAFGGLMLLYNTSSLPRSLASRVLPSSMF
ncbi:hypothetical protein [Xanthomonas cannabis]|uniref:Uncharacterized protein n=1 Tax=Xanthomonas cannabis TaxID=1885674 RepID=A0ABR6JQW2_9XANT|nr:hypothetical protein [Xanthomonas cannabis]MBB4595124.1 hypothetical protein [Xanthomonas cannabis]MBB5523940.1 hypothetical protein [Xanthomonas cannabis]